MTKVKNYGACMSWVASNRPGSRKRSRIYDTDFGAAVIKVL